MRKYIFLLMLFLIPAISYAIDVDSCILEPENTEASSTGSNAYYDLTQDITGCGNIILGDYNGYGYEDVYNVSINLHGYTWYGGIEILGDNLYSVEIFNGTFYDGHILLVSQGEMTGLYLHDLNLIGFFNGGRIEISSGVIMGDVTLENVNIYNKLGYTYEWNDISDLRLKNVNFVCDYEVFTCYFDITSFNYMNAYFENVKFSPGWNNAGECNKLTLYLVNTTLPQEQNCAGFGTSIYKLEEATFIVKDNNNNLIDAMGVAVSLNGEESGISNLLSRAYNPTKIKKFAVNNGIATEYLVKNATIFNYNYEKKVYDFNYYNVTMKSRNKQNSKIITFNSPAYAEFILEEERSFNLFDAILNIIRGWFK